MVQKGRRQPKQRQWTVGLDFQEPLHQRSEIVRRQPEVADEDFREAFSSTRKSEAATPAPLFVATMARLFLSKICSARLVGEASCSTSSLIATSNCPV
ncbi:hypothetical protein A6X20_37665 [Bradyrhizobium elkanii]|nr:hypothetical protein A6X20_37665 [Bradyrhizobium elkanii]ODM76460.1 hypothetical protein A6452_35525 [Bradyrhizobium elkanii]